MRENIVTMLERCTEFVAYYDQELLSCENFPDLMKAAGMSTYNSFI